jgi:hypothetical protein
MSNRRSGSGGGKDSSTPDAATAAAAATMDPSTITTTTRPSSYLWKRKIDSCVLTAFGCGFLLANGLQVLWQWQTRSHKNHHPTVPFALPKPEESFWDVYHQILNETGTRKPQTTSSRTSEEMTDMGTTQTPLFHAFDVLAHHAYETMRQRQSSSPASSDQRPVFNLAHWTEPQRSQGGLLDPDRLMIGRLYRRANSVFEWGLGESTLIAKVVQVPRYVGIDSDPHYVNTTRVAVKAPHFRFLLADVGETEDWGYPQQILAKNFWSYYVAPLFAEPDSFDVYLVDGRYRMACLLTAFLHAARYGHSDPIVLVHDCDRAHYHVADSLLEKMESGGLLCQYKRRSSTSDAQLLYVRINTQYTLSMGLLLVYTFRLDSSRLSFFSLFRYVCFLHYTQ